jgi:hypothetical protein
MAFVSCRIEKNEIYIFKRIKNTAIEFSQEKKSCENSSFIYHVLYLQAAFPSALLAMNTCFPSKHLSPTDVTHGKLEYT